MTAVPEFEAFYRVEHPRVLGTLCALAGDRDTAVDATDEAFVRAYERWERVRHMDAPAAWTYTVALNALKRTKRRRALEATLLRRRRDVDVVPTHDPELWDAVRALPARQREAVVLRYVADLPEAQIAEVMRIARGTVASTLSDARRALATLLTDETTDVSDARLPEVTR
ncbi:MAG TPA: sigma-70 family RNA polymerase sigma factor [Acidimicrobiia bacterium]|nr:sigma-70 family RNA polymerase sigma factor [Acidimicrobiia bacterium]